MSIEQELASGLCAAIVEQASEAVIYADRDGIVRLWNRGAETIFGFAADEAIGRDLDLIIPERFRAAHNAGYRRAMDTGQVRLGGRVLTTRSQHKNGDKLYVDLSFGLVKNEAGAPQGAFAIGRDVTARQLQEAARSAAAGARQS
ncbi:MAG TPA: PAS domain S-box protein [Ramlibacter sp.]|nr:PAS domain S-box protein [Ramlibacter sp.]